MPHQCLKCGHVFEQNSAQLLKGCPDCGGSRFFFTLKPLDEQERNAISQEMSNDITKKVIDMLVEQHKDKLDKNGKWVSIKSKDIRKFVEEQLNETIQEKTKTHETPDIMDDNFRNARLEKIKKEAEQSQTPETIDIEHPGRYKIDLKGLLEKEPIVIQKDGSYTIHLPSLFKMIEKE
ncbi:MAG: Zn-ribbon containing protein [Candidatus Thermoplasmatota archaeon]